MVELGTGVRAWAKAVLPYGVVCAVARAVNRPWWADVARTERVVEYPWALAEIGRFHHVGEPILDFGYAGSYFAQALTQFGPVTGVDPRRTPAIRHPRFTHQWPLEEDARYDTICAISCLEHFDHAGVWRRTLQRMLRPGGQLLVTVPCGPTTTRFRGYLCRSLCDIYDWEGLESFHVFVRDPGGWVPLDAARTDVPDEQETDLAALVEHLPESTEHQVNAVACVRLTGLGRSPDLV